MKLAEYFARIAYPGPYNKPDLETLTRILEHHITTIPFENLSLHCGETIVLNMEAFFDKLVRKNRGGCCVENNGLFYWVLKEMGYNVTMLTARIYKTSKERYEGRRGHLLLLVTIDGKNYITDVGFISSYQIRQPLQLVSGKEQPQLPGTFCLTEVNNIWHLEKVGRKLQVEDKSNVSPTLLNRNTHQKLYCFNLAPRRLEDFEEALIHYTTSPKSPLLKLSFVCCQTTNGYKTLKGWTYSENIFNGKDGKDLRISTTLTDEEVQHLIKESFNLKLEKGLVPVENYSNSLLE